MWLKSIQANKIYPNYENVRLDFDHVNIFLGSNSAGKTRLLETLFQLAQAQAHSNIPLLESYADEIYPEYNFKLTSSSSGILPYRYLSANRGPASTLTIGSQEANQNGRNDGDLLSELEQVPLLRPLLEYEIEHLFGISFSFGMKGSTWNWYADDGMFRGYQHEHGRGLHFYESLFFYLNHPAVRVLLIDEPENSLHPQIQRALFARIRQVAHKYDKQIFLATHSPLFALPETIEDLKGIFLLQRHHKPPRILALSSLVPSDKADRRRFESFLPNLDPSIAELFFASGGLIVEGQTERQFMQYIAQRVNSNPHQYGITIVESNGLGLMPGLIRVARSVLKHWSALCDGDLLTNGSKSFDGYRLDLGRVLGITISKMPKDETTTIQSALHEQDVFVLSKDCLEELYCSPAMSVYRTDHKNVESADKGWLMEQEIEFLQGKDSNFIKETYAELLRPLDVLIDKVRRTALQPRTMPELVQDLLFDDANEIHQQVYRHKWDENTLRQFLGASRRFALYDLTFRAFDDYEIRWENPLGNLYRICCKDKGFSVEHAPQSDPKYIMLRSGTV